MDEETMTIGGAVALLVAIAGLIVWLVLSGAGSCPKGQHSVITGWVPTVVSTGRTTIVEEIPITQCER